jgi:hypothetical protein
MEAISLGSGRNRVQVKIDQAHQLVLEHERIVANETSPRVPPGRFEPFVHRQVLGHNRYGGRTGPNPSIKSMAFPAGHSAVARGSKRSGANRR